MEQKTIPGHHGPADQADSGGILVPPPEFFSPPNATPHPPPEYNPGPNTSNQLHLWSGSVYAGSLGEYDMISAMKGIGFADKFTLKFFPLQNYI
jgi:hypothetical protein